MTSWYYSKSCAAVDRKHEYVSILSSLGLSTCVMWLYNILVRMHKSPFFSPILVLSLIGDNPNFNSRQFNSGAPQYQRVPLTKTSFTTPPQHHPILIPTVITRKPSNSCLPKIASCLSNYSLIDPPRPSASDAVLPPAGPKKRERQESLDAFSPSNRRHCK